MNSKHGIYIAGSGKDAGKTTISMGLVSYFKKIFPEKVTFMKPLGQKTSFVDGTGVGQDSFLLGSAMNLDVSLNYSAPFSTGSGAAEKYILTGEPKNLKKRVLKAFKHLNSHYKIVVVEGTGHPGVGSVFDLSNAKVAAMFKIPVILVLNGGIGSTIDKFNLSITPFEKEHVRVIGVIINKILPSKQEKIKKILSAYFEDKNIPVLGYIPYENSLSAPSLGVIKKELEIETLYLNDSSDIRKVSGFIYAFGSREEVLNDINSDPGKVLLVSKTRDDVIDPVIARCLSGIRDSSPAALVLCGEGMVDDWLKRGCEKASLPLFETKRPFEKTVKDLQYRVFKVEPDESEKIEKIIELIERTVDMDMIQKLLLSPQKDEKIVKRNVIKSFIKGSLSLFGNFIKKK